MRPVVVSDPGFLPTARQMALACSDRLAAYVTALWSPTQRLGRDVGRRPLPDELARAATRAATTTEVARLALARAHVHRFNYGLLWRRNVEADRVAARLVPPDGTVIAEYGCGLAAFRRVHGEGTAILDYPIARLQEVYAILEEERALRPAFADTLFGRGTQVASPGHLARMDEEVALADVVVVGSEFARASFDGTDARRVEAIPYGVDTARFSPRGRPRDDGPLRVLFAGQLTQRKGVAYLLEALELLDPARYSLTLAGPVAGSGRGLARHAGRFEHRSGLTRAQMPDVYRAHDVLVLPSLAEGSALVVLEAMASGLPVVVTPNAGADAVRDGVDGVVVPIRSPEAIAAALESLADEERRAAMGRAAHERAQALTWERFRHAFRALADEPERSVAVAAG